MMVKYGRNRTISLVPPLTGKAWQSYMGRNEMQVCLQDINLKLIFMAQK